MSQTKATFCFWNKLDTQWKRYHKTVSGFVVLWKFYACFLSQIISPFNFFQIYDAVVQVSSDVKPTLNWWIQHVNESCSDDHNSSAKQDLLNSLSNRISQYEDIHRFFMDSFLFQFPKGTDVVDDFSVRMTEFILHNQTAFVRFAGNLENRLKQMKVSVTQNITNTTEICTKEKNLQAVENNDWVKKIEYHLSKGLKQHEHLVFLVNKDRTLTNWIQKQKNRQSSHFK